MGPLAAVLLGGGLALTAKYVYDKSKEPKALDPGQLPLVDPQNNPGLVRALNKGRTYAVLATFAVKEMPGGEAAVANHQVDKDGGSRYLRAIFEQQGFKVLSDPTPRSEAEAQRFFAGDTSVWVFNAQWTKADTGRIDLDPAVNRIIPNAVFYILPVS